jgi:hypothetical protein
MTIVTVKNDEKGNVDFTDLKEKAEMHKHNLAALMVLSRIVSVLGNDMPWVGVWGRNVNIVVMLHT